MPTFSRIFIGIIVCHASFASAVQAQPVASDYGVRAAQAAAGPVLVLNVRHQSSDTLLVQLEAAGTLFDRMLYEPWWPSRGTTRLSREEGGRAIARAAWVSYPQVGQKIAVVVINVRSSERADDPTRIRLIYDVAVLGSPSG